MDNTAQFNQLYWQCRRGMWELDLYLIPFLHDQFNHLTPALQHDFVQLLEIPDPELHAYLNGHQKPANVSLIEIIQLVREHAKQSDKSQIF